VALSHRPSFAHISKFRAIIFLFAYKFSSLLCVEIGVVQEQVSAAMQSNLASSNAVFPWAVRLPKLIKRLGTSPVP